jgi:hypothetical protein
MVICLSVVFAIFATMKVKNIGETNLFNYIFQYYFEMFSASLL